MKLFNIKSFRLNTFHIILVILAVLLLSKIGFGVKEYFENNDVSSTETSSSSSSSSTQSALPKGIPFSQIPNGEEDLYIKKSEIVPPVCPKCPDVTVCPKQEKCSPCPPCARCPEPSYECKLVPNYNVLDDDVVPRPVLTDFSNFGI
jgi:hypothetical protein